MVGKPVSDEDLISYLIGGINPRYNAFITSFTLMTKDESMSLADFQTFLLSHEQLLNSQAASIEPSSFAMHAQKPRFTNQRQNQSRFSNQKGNFSSPQNKFFNSAGTSPKVSQILANLFKILIVLPIRFVAKVAIMP
jgi:hypothetical protein